MSWLVGRYDGAKDRTPEREADLIQMLERHGLDPKDIMPLLVVTVGLDGQHRMHLSRLVNNGEGRRVIDVARDQVASEPVVIDVEPDSWPAWLAGLNSREGAMP